MALKRSDAMSAILSLSGVKHTRYAHGKFFPPVTRSADRHAKCPLEEACPFHVVGFGAEIFPANPQTVNLIGR